MLEESTMGRDMDRQDERYRKRKDKEDAYRRQLPGEDETPLPPPVETIHGEGKSGRNDPCPCGSGKKFNQCCGKK
jgi:uncharacterized protein YecA (UPF0149 family)